MNFAAVSPSAVVGTDRLFGDYFQARVLIAAISGVVMVTGVALGQPLLLGGGAAGICMIVRNVEQILGPHRDSRLSELAVRLLRGCGPYEVDGGKSGGSRPATKPGAPAQPPSPDEPEDQQPLIDMDSIESTGELVAEMLRTNRYALLLRPETASHIDRGDYRLAIRELDERMALVPEGSVLVGMAAERATLGQASSEATPGQLQAKDTFDVRACYLDRWTVSNAEYQQFVDAGGYEQLELWPEESLPALFDFIDTSGCTAPRYWSDGRLIPGQEQLPVVGVSWYEAVAYSRWVGKRLPGDAEWTKACAWPIESAPGRIAQRRYPWGESFDSRRANLWSSGEGGPVEVDAHPDGATVGGLVQMVGNIWEWTNQSLDETTPEAVRFPTALRSIRGGAYNTYFENQATCHFQSGEHPLARRANIGIRLALDMAGLASPQSVDPS